MTAPFLETTTLSFIIFVAAILSSIVGFAFSAIAAALVLQCVGDAVLAVQIMMIASIGIQAYSVARLAPEIRWSRCAPFVAGGLLTLPIGVFFVFNMQPRAYIATIGAALIAYGLYMLLRRPVRSYRRAGRFADVLAGAVGGITGPLAASPGFSVTMRCDARGWNKIEQRAVYQPYILIMQTLAVAALSVMQPPERFDPALFAYALPGLAGAVIGLRVFHALNDSQFQRLINLALVVSGCALVFK